MEFSTRQVCESLGIKERRLRQVLYSHRHLYPAKRIGRTLVWVQGEVDALSAHLAAHSRGYALPKGKKGSKL